MILNEESVNALLEDERLTKREAEDICDYLSIDSDVVFYDLCSFKRNSAILLALYYSDIVDKENKLCMRVKQVDYIYDLIDVLTEECYDIVSIEDLIKLYKCRVIDLRDIIYEKVNHNLEDMVMKIAKNYNVVLNENNKEDFLSMAKEFYFNALEMVKPESDKKILYNIEKYVKVKLREAMKTYNEILEHEVSPQTLGLDERLLRKIEEEKLAIISLDYAFGEAIEPAFSKLKDTEKEFLVLRFKENYTRNELAKIYNKSYAGIEAQERCILTKLRRAMGKRNICK